MKNVSLLKVGLPLFFSAFVVGCAGTPSQANLASNQPENNSIPSAHVLVIPEPLEHSDGEYLSPFTSDEVVAPWVEKGMNAEIGSAVGAYAGQYALRKVPFVGSYLGDWAGSEVGRLAAIEMIGGEEYMKSTTDISFDSVEDLIVYTYANYSDHPDYEKVIDLVGDVYPDFEQSYAHTLANAEVTDSIEH